MRVCMEDRKPKKFGSTPRAWTRACFALGMVLIGYVPQERPVMRCTDTLCSESIAAASKPQTLPLNPKPSMDPEPPLLESIAAVHLNPRPKNRALRCTQGSDGCGQKPAGLGAHASSELPTLSFRCLCSVSVPDLFQKTVNRKPLTRNPKPSQDGGDGFCRSLSFNFTGFGDDCTQL
jgi:hypothetical protein